MGGAAGHITHLYENDQLTFGEIKEILASAAEGRLTKVSEKLDGMNLMFTLNRLNQLRVARNTSDIRKGGMSKSELASKFAGRGNVEDAFNTGFNVLKSALGTIPSQELTKTFQNGTKWYSLELIYSGLANTINYDKDHIVFHGWPTYKVVNDEHILTNENENDGDINMIKSHLDKMQLAVASRNWNICGPKIVRLKKLTDGSILKNVCSRLNDVTLEAGLNDENTIQDFIYEKAFQTASQTGASEVDAQMVAARLAHMPGHQNLTAIKKRANAKHVDSLSELVRTEKSYKKIWMEPIELAIHDFSVEVLRGLHSSLVGDGEEEVSRLRAVLANAINAIQSSQHQGSLDVLNTQMQKLKGVHNINSSLEGIVFFYKGQAYKFTGSFAPAHQIISLFTYGKDGITFKPESSLGGRAFQKVSPITLEQLKHTMPQLREDLSDLGAFGIKPIGTTGKKDVMSDVDLTCECTGDASDFYERACDLLNPENVRRVGRNVSLRYPIFESDGPSRKHVQVDVMIGDANFIEWSRYGPSPKPGHKEYSRVKGVLRNLLLNQTLRVMSEHKMMLESSSLDRKRYAFDFDKGLYIITQTKRGKRKSLKNWKTLQREFVSSDPDEIVETIFGERYSRDNTKTFEQVMLALLMSENTKHFSKRVIESFVEEIEKFAATSPKFFNGDPWETVDYIKSLFVY